MKHAIMPATVFLLIWSAGAVADTTGDLLARWVALDAPIGHEHMATDRLLESLPGWERDTNGNLFRRVGSGSARRPRRVVACGLDWHAFVVSQIRDDGYLRLHTFVSSDTPLESSHFAYAPLGDGPVLRSIENSSLAPPAERERILALARSAQLRVQIGLTQGGTDGTTFTFWGAPNAGLSWPGRYSHSPAEVLDLRDLVGLYRLIRLVAEASR